MKSNVNVSNMPDDCRFNDSWTLSDEYAHWISQTIVVINVRKKLKKTLINAFFMKK